MRPAHMRPAYMRPAHERPTDMHATHVAPADEAAMDVMPAMAAEEVAVAIEVAAIRPSPAIPVMSPTRPAMNLVDEVGVFDGVTQAVGAAERDGGGGLGEQAGGHDRCSRNDQCECPHGFPPDRTCRPPLPSHVRLMLYQTLAQRFVADSFIACSCHVHPLSCRVIRVMCAGFPSRVRR